MDCLRLLINADHSETDVGIALRTIAGVVGIFATALVTTGIPRTALDNILAVGGLSRSPLPTVTPEVYATTSSCGLLVSINSRQTTFHVIAIHSNILWHVTSTEYPVFF